MKLRFSRKTWYFCLLATAALNLLNGMAALLGHNLAFLDTVAFGGTGISVLFLAAQKGAPVRRKVLRWQKSSAIFWCSCC